MKTKIKKRKMTAWDIKQGHQQFEITHNEHSFVLCLWDNGNSLHIVIPGSKIEDGRKIIVEKAEQ